MRRKITDDRNNQSPADEHVKPRLPKTVPGAWRAEVLAAGSLHLGSTVNQAPSPHAIEFSFMTLPACAYGPGKIALPAVIVLMAPAEPVEHGDVGTLMQNGLVTVVDLFVTRPLFSDLIPRIENGRIRMMSFEVGQGGGSKFPITSWNVSASFSDGTDGELRA